MESPPIAGLALVRPEPSGGVMIDLPPESSHRRPRPRRLALLLAGVTVAGGLAVAPSATAAVPTTGVIVREDPGAGNGPEQAVERLGGTVTLELGIIDGFAAEVPVTAVDDLAEIAGVASVSPDGTVKMSAAKYDPSADTGSMYKVHEVLGTPAVWRDGARGAGVDVALIDTGVSMVPGLQTPGKVLYGPDLSFDSQDEAYTNVDGFGHGTHLAGIIAGSDGGDPTKASSRKSGYYGIAPGARIVSVKVGDRNGVVDVSQVIAAIDWVVQHRNTDGLNIRVLNLSFGTQSTQSYLLDPLSFAAEQAWHNGIFVVTAGGNDGDVTPGLNSPAYNPYLVAVGSNDTKGTVDTTDDVISDFSSRGDGVRNPDLLAPGAKIQGLRVPGSAIDVANPAARLGDRFLRGSGTSQAAAIVSGAAAVAFSLAPNLTNDDLKYWLKAYARTVPAADVFTGKGLLSFVTSTTVAPPGSTLQTWPRSTGTGSLEASRGGLHVVDGGTGAELTGEVDIFGNTFDAAAWAETSAAGTSWTEGDWNGTTWTGVRWSGVRWSGVRWTSNAWSGSTWAGLRWSGVRWSGLRWSSTGWSGAGWG